MQNLKLQTHCALSKILSEIQKQANEDNPLSQNPQNQSLPVACKQLINLYALNMDARDKMLVQLAFMNQLVVEMTVAQLKGKIMKTIAEMNVEQNQFNVPVAELTRNYVEKGAKTKKKSQTKKTQPNVESHPEYFRVDLEVCTRLFEHYKTMPLGMPRHGAFNFQQKEHHKTSLNYHKIVEMFKDVGLNLEINQKLLILRSIKKFCFNQNFINKEQFIKVFKVIVHSLGYKQQIFEQYLKKRNLFSAEQPTKKYKNSIPKPRKNYRFKTDTSLTSEPKNAQANLSHLNISILNESSSNQADKKPQKQGLTPIPQTQGNASYLVRAMENQKISKITWDSLFNMKQTSMHSYIVIPSFIRNQNVEQW